MQQDHNLKKENFDLLTPRDEGGGGCLLAKYLIHVATFVIVFYLISNMTLFRKVEL